MAHGEVIPGFGSEERKLGGSLQRGRAGVSGWVGETGSHWRTSRLLAHFAVAHDDDEVGRGDGGQAMRDGNLPLVDHALQPPCLSPWFSLPPFSVSSLLSFPIIFFISDRSRRRSLAALRSSHRYLWDALSFNLPYATLPSAASPSSARRARRALASLAGPAPPARVADARVSIIGENSHDSSLSATGKITSGKQSFENSQSYWSQTASL
jgi:hypothetical protein